MAGREQISREQTTENCFLLATGISMHKGYAFVQFTDTYDARNAILGEDGRTVAGQILGKCHTAGRESTGFCPV